jgi:hypothetical protein
MAVDASLARDRKTRTSLCPPAFRVALFRSPKLLAALQIDQL